MDPVTWREAWQQALYAAGSGFYVARGGPAAHFTTATHGPTGAALARALLALSDHPVRVVVDIGAGRGELATHLLAALPGAPASEAGSAPDSEAGSASDSEAGSRSAPTVGGRQAPLPRVVAVDVVDRPEGLDERVEWVRSPGGPSLPDRLAGLEDALVVAHEWLDVVPCTVAQVDDSGVLRTVLVDPTTGAESLGDPLSGDELAWAQQHWATSEPGSRVEVGLSRDRAWRDLVSRVRSGTVVAVDYGHVATSRPHEGTLAAYVEGRLTQPVPDGTCDLTAHVAMDTLGADEVLSQRAALRSLGVGGAAPPHALATSDPLAYLAGLERSAAEASLLDPGGFGAFWWAVRRVDRGNVP